MNATPGVRKVFIAWMILLMAPAGCSTPPTTAFMPTFTGDPNTRPIVLVKPIQVDRSRGTNVASTDELTELMVQKLRGRKIRSGPMDSGVGGPAWELGCELPEVRYDMTRSYPRRITYQAQLHCTIADPSTHQMLWDRRLDAKYDERVLFNMMTKRPEHHDWVLYRECVVPLFDGMAYGIELFLDRPPKPAKPTTTTPAPMIEAPPSGYTK